MLSCTLLAAGLRCSLHVCVCIHKLREPKELQSHAASSMPAHFYARVSRVCVVMCLLCTQNILFPVCASERTTSLGSACAALVWSTHAHTEIHTPSCGRWHASRLSSRSRSQSRRTRTRRIRCAYVYVSCGVVCACAHTCSVPRVGRGAAVVVAAAIAIALSARARADRARVCVAQSRSRTSAPASQRRAPLGGFLRDFCRDTPVVLDVAC